ncbi:MAG: ATP-binding protein [Deltaproteobacteria bacterium]|nr:ATP-binding protein [Deltaproteobacteria bacterium]
MIQRHVSKLLLNYLEQFPAVVLLGPRQVGKTTLSLAVAEGRKSVYLDLERPEDQKKLSDAALYLSAHEDKMVILDEVQRAPGLFQTLRGVIDQGRRSGKKYGRFLLLGSASVELIKQTGETLAGRVAYLELPILNVLEIEQSLSNELWLRGGFPDSFLASSDASSLAWRQNFIRTYLERDIPQLGPRIPAETMRRFWTMLAHSQGSLLNSAELGRSLAIDGKSITRYLDLMVDLLLVRRLQPFYANINKRLVKSPKVYVRDSGLTHALLGVKDFDTLLGHPVIGASWEGFVIETLLNVLPASFLPFFYRTAAGAEIDLVLELSPNKHFAIEIKRGLSPKLEKGFYNAISDLEPERAFVVYSGEERYPLGQNIEVIGLKEMANLLANHQG